jgi:hypothetical protein
MMITCERLINETRGPVARGRERRHVLELAHAPHRVDTQMPVALPPDGGRGLADRGLPADVADSRAGSAWCNAQATCSSENIDRFIWCLLWWAEGLPSPALSRFGVPSISGDTSP